MSMSAPPWWHARSRNFSGWRFSGWRSSGWRSSGWRSGWRPDVPAARPPFRLPYASAMRLLFFLIVLVNIAVLAYGQGFFGPPPSEQGREPRMLMMQRNPEAVTLGAPLTPEQAQAIQAAPAHDSAAAPAKPHATRH